LCLESFRTEFFKNWPLVLRYKFSIGGLNVNLKTGLLRISPDEKDVVQNVALVAIL
jgi:hypothetical protein